MTTPIIVRRAHITDLPVIQSLNSELFHEDATRDKDLNLQWTYEAAGEKFLRQRIEETGICLVGEIDNNIVGYLAGAMRKPEPWRTRRRSEIENMCVAAQFRKSGVGKKLMTHFITWSQENGADQIIVEAFDGNTNAIGFYQAMDFEPYSHALQRGV